MIPRFENPLIEEKDRTQKKLYEKAHGDLGKYRRLAEEAARRLYTQHPEMKPPGRSHASP
jgi:hypothetical protein